MTQQPSPDGPRANHALALYVLGAFAVFLGLTAHARMDRTPRTVVSVQHAPAPKASRSAWAGLGMDATIKLGEALQQLPKTKAVIYCSSSDCDALAHDLDDAFQIADWPSEIERARVDAQADVGIFVGPSTSIAEALRDELWKTFEGNVRVERAQMQEFPGTVGIIIGKRAPARR